MIDIIICVYNFYDFFFRINELVILEKWFEIFVFNIILRGFCGIIEFIFICV